MKEKRNWKESNNPSFDDPNNATEKSKTIAQNGILSILGKNIGLLSRKHAKEKQKKYERSDSSSSKPQNKIKSFLQFKKPGDNKVTSASSLSKSSKESKKKEDEIKVQKKTLKAKPAKNSQLLDNNECGNPIKSIISNKKQSKSVKDPISSNRGGSGQGPPDTLTTKTKNFKQNKAQAPKSSKPAVERRVTKSKLRKSSSDSELNVSRARPPRASSARSSASSSRPQSTLTSRCSSRTTLNSTASSMVNTPVNKKKSTTRKNPTKKKKTKTSSSPESPDSGHGSSGSSGSPPTVFVNYRYQVSQGWAGDKSARVLFLSLLTVSDNEQIPDFNCVKREIQKHNKFQCFNRKHFLQFCNFIFRIGDLWRAGSDRRFMLWTNSWRNLKEKTLTGSAWRRDTSWISPNVLWYDLHNN